MRARFPVLNVALYLQRQRRDENTRLRNVVGMVFAGALLKFPPAGDAERARRSDQSRWLGAGAQGGIQWRVETARHQRRR